LLRSGIDTRGRRLEAIQEAMSGKSPGRLRSAGL